MKNNHPYIGSTLDELLDEEELLVTANETAIKRVIAWQIAQEIETKNARLSPSPTSLPPRVPGTAAEMIKIAPDFGDPLPDDILAGFEG